MRAGLVRQKDYKRQQQVAMEMYKAHKKSPYYFWAVMSIVMQAYKAKATPGMERLANMMLLPLAEKMMVKAAEEKRITGAETLRLCVPAAAVGSGSEL